MVTTYLDKILAVHRSAAAVDTRDLEQLIERAKACAPTRGFRNALLRARPSADNGLGVIAEIKRRSPSKGDLNPGIDAAEWAAAYQSGGATCLSVLTDRDHFGGSPDDLVAARGAVSIPVIRKDFTVNARDVVDARLMGADAVLLIVAALDQVELADFHQLALELGLDALVETHDEPEVERALAVGADLIGVNQRDLVTFEVDTARAVRVGQSLPEHVVRVAESGVGGPEDAGPLAAAGYHAVLVGESLVRSGDPSAAVAALRAVTG
ncbi:MAG: indole-3-glycerol phosphate synthase TrpC [Actinomycetota bacterium]|nr:indole-3-glycerol phosphate synthase TrpC [Actinomycetota bacterium]